MSFLIIGEKRNMFRDIIESDTNARPNSTLFKMNNGIEEEKLAMNNPRKYSSNFFISFISEIHAIV